MPAAAAAGAVAKKAAGVARGASESIEQTTNAVAGGIVNGSFNMPDNPMNKIRLPRGRGGGPDAGSPGGNLQAALAAREAGRGGSGQTPGTGDRSGGARRAVLAVGGGPNAPYPKPSPASAQGEAARNQRARETPHQQR